MHMLSRKDLSSAELETLQKSRILTTVTTTKWEVHTSEEAHVNFHDLELFVMVQILDDTPAVLSLGVLCEEHGCANEWTSGQKQHLTKNGKTILCNKEKSFLLFSQDCHQARAQVRLAHRNRRTHRVWVQQDYEVTIRTLKRRETEAIQQKPK